MYNVLNNKKARKVQTIIILLLFYNDSLHAYMILVYMDEIQLFAKFQAYIKPHKSLHKAYIKMAQK